VYVFDTGFGLYMSTATKAEGPWEPATCVMRGENYSDPCPFWDDDGQMYVTGARYPTWVDDKPRMYDMFLWKLSPDGKKLQDNGTIIRRGIGTEGTKILKINGYYYIFFCEHQDGDFKNDRIQMVMRSKHLYGNYETHRMIQQRKEEDRQPCQGGLVDTKDGTWWFLHQAGNANYLGRQAILEPVTWINDWPIVGNVMPDGVGSMIWEYKKPVQGFPITKPQSSDDFSSETLQPQWMWNHAPRDDKWSLTERKGFLRLYASQPAYKGFWGACNTLTQRTMGYKPAEATVLIDVSKMADGQVAGLAAIGGSAWMLQVYQENGKRILRTKVGNEVNSFNITLDKKNGSKIWMKVLTDKNKYHFQFSLDGKKFEDIGSVFTPYFNNWRAVQLGIFSFNEKQNAGYVDVDWFTYDYR
jgi:beta-xylosidase